MTQPRSISPTRPFTTSLTDFALPFATPISIPSSSSSSVGSPSKLSSREPTIGLGVTGSPPLGQAWPLRSSGVSPPRLRRSSMLGREITQTPAVEPSSSLKLAKQVGFQPIKPTEDVEMDEGAMGPPAPTTPPRSMTHFSSSDSGQDSSRTGSGSPGILPTTGTRSRSSSAVGRGGSTAVVRRAVNRRQPKDCGVLRVAASLQDENKPEDSEIASEAKLQKRLGGDPSLPRTPKLGGLRAKTPCFPGGGARFAYVTRRRWAWDEEDQEDTFEMDGLEDTSEEEMVAKSDEETEMLEEPQMPLEEGPSSLKRHRRGSLWMGFRETKPYYRASPGTVRSRTPAGFPVDIETSPKATIGSSPGPWTRTAKRKTIGGDDRYEPYKRRAISPMTLLATTSPSLQAGAQQASAVPTPISMPSPTHTFSTSASSTGGFGGYFHYKPSQLGGIPSRGGSPAVISRPTTPARAVTASGILHNYAMAAQQPQSPNVAPTPLPGSATGKNTGSGPGYGSRALGLSIAGGSGGLFGSLGTGNTSGWLSAAAMGEEIEGEEMDKGVRMLGLS